MRITTLDIENFKKFDKLTLELNEAFTLLVGENGSGKTTVLDALAVALGLWHKAAPGSGWRNILAEEIRIEPVRAGDRVVFEPRLPSKVSVKGTIGSKVNLSWTRMVRQGGTRTTNAEARDAEAAITELAQLAEQQRAPLPVLAYYGAGRAWLATNKRPPASPSQKKPSRLDAYHHCLDPRINDKKLNEWFLFEAAASNGQGRPGLRAVTDAVLGCVADADRLRYDGDLKEIVLSIGGVEQPFYNLSAGQRMMLALVADLAIKAVMLNSYLLGDSVPPIRVLNETPGVVLIDELDVHLHPRWQRRVVADLQRTFPRIQFICTSHSPQVIGELPRDQIRLLHDTTATVPPRSYGVDSSRILSELMDASPRNDAVAGLLDRLFLAIEREDFGGALPLSTRTSTR